MAYQLKFSYPQNGLPFLWNISAHVGCSASCPNKPTDVELVQFFLSELIGAGVIGTQANAATRLPKIAVNGKYDAITGFWLFYSETGGSSTAVVDGIASPAKGVVYGTGAWAIAKMNHAYKQMFPTLWENLKNDVRLSAALRMELAKNVP